VGEHRAGVPAAARPRARRRPPRRRCSGWRHCGRPAVAGHEDVADSWQGTERLANVPLPGVPRQLDRDEVVLDGEDRAAGDRNVQAGVSKVV
jgi:hypothetical protein